MKKELSKGFIAGILTATLVFTLIVPAMAATVRQLNATYSGIQITLDGKKVAPTDANGNPVEPFAVDGTTYLPVRAVANALGLGVAWDQATQTVALTSPGYIAPSPAPSPAPTSLAWDAEYSIGGLSYKVPSLWTHEDKSGTQYFYIDPSKDRSMGLLQVYAQESTINLSDKSNADSFFSGASEGFKSNTDFSRNFVPGTVSPFGSNGWMMVCSYDFIVDGSNTMPARTVVVAYEYSAIAFSLFIPSDYSTPIDSCQSSLTASFVLSEGNSSQAPSYAERLAAVSQRALNGERITYSKFLAIQNGMTYIEVAEIIGDLGTTVAESDNVRIEQWKSSDGGYASVTFVDGKVTSKSQAGL